MVNYRMSNKNNSVITLTFGDMAENHVGMEKIGKMVEEGKGFNLQDLNEYKLTMENLGCGCDLYLLSDEYKPEAHVLVIRNGVNELLKDENISLDMLFEEQINLNFDTKVYMYGSVKNKKARWNLCYDCESREPNYESGQGRIIGYDEIPITNKLRQKFEYYFGEKAHDMKIEANNYYDINKCGIGFHGDAERRKVIGVRLGLKQESMPLYYQWYKDGIPNGEKIRIPLNNGDIYIMSEKSVGTDWKKKKIFTLRHATGCDKYTNVKLK